MTPLQPRHPSPQGERIVGAETLDVRDLEARILHESLNVADAIELSIGEDVPIDELGGQIQLQRDSSCVMPWFKNNPPGLSNRRTVEKYNGRFLSPTCSNMPMLATLS